MKSKCLSIIVVLLLVPFGVNAGEWVTVDKTQCKIWSTCSAPNLTVSWSGNCESGYASGFGTVIHYENGKEIERYEGQIKMGKRNGKGTYTWANGDKYEGDYVDGKGTGKGTITYGYGSKRKWAGDKYEGDVLNGNLHGKGTYTCANGKQFTGNWDYGIPVGFTINCN